MNTIFIIEDILDYLKFHIDIRDYDADGRCFPDYFIKYINEFANTLYIL
jgi:hypothetical protein